MKDTPSAAPPLSPRFADRASEGESASCQTHCPAAACWFPCAASLLPPAAFRWPAASEEGIRQYAAPKAEAPEKVSLIGVIYPHGDLTWFFKLMGPESAVAAQAEAVSDFLNSVHFTDKGDRPIEWKLPEGWQPVVDAKANNPGHYATLRIEAKNRPSLDMTVTKFPGDGRRPPGQRQPLAQARWACSRSSETNWTRRRGRKSSTATRLTVVR